MPEELTASLPAFICDTPYRKHSRSRYLVFMALLLVDSGCSYFQPPRVTTRIYLHPDTPASMYVIGKDDMLRVQV